MKPVDVIKQLQTTNSRIEKERILFDAWNSGCHEFFRGAKMAYDPLLTFGINQIPKILDEGDIDVTFTSVEFHSLANKLAKRELTGNAAIDAVGEAALTADTTEWMLWFRPILLKDLRAGITSTTINKVLNKIDDEVSNQFIIPIFSCQLAKDSDNQSHNMTGKKYLDVKINGVRLITILDKETKQVTQFTRQGRLNDNFPHLVNQLSNLLDIIPGSIVLDGEVTGFDFRDLMTQLNRKYDKDTKDAKLALFDIIPLDDFRKGQCNITQKDRHQALMTLEQPLYEYTNGDVYILPKKEIDLSTDDGWKSLYEFNKLVLEQKYEGIMIKDPNAPYICDRSVHWLKKKPFYSFDLIVNSVEEGTGKNEGRLGNINCSGTYDGKQINVSVGSGFKDKERNEYWIIKEQLIGRIIEIEADEISQNKEGDYSLRFPRFVKFRDAGSGTDKI